MAITICINGEVREATESSASKVLATIYQSAKSDEKGAIRLDIPNLTTDLEVAFPGIEGYTFLMIFTDHPITLKLEPTTGGPYLPADLTPITVNSFMILFGDFAKAYLSNNSGNQAVVCITTLGEVAA